jgi:malonyl CoA-acyl carrier protein transacylase
MIKNLIQSTTLVELLLQRAQNQADKLAYSFLVDGETEKASLTYAQLEQQARAIAAQLQKMVASGERALLLYPQGLDYIAAFFGCLYAGIIAVPAYPPRRNRSDIRLQAIATDAQPKIVLTTNDILAKTAGRLIYAPELKKIPWLATHDFTESATGLRLSQNWQEPEIAPDTLALLQYTSGSTGTPKGVMVSHGNLLHNSAYISSVWQLNPNSAMVTWLPIFHDMGLVFGILQPLYHGCSCYIMSPTTFIQHPFRWLQAISRYQATHSGAPNFAYELCVNKITKKQRATLDLSAWEMSLNGAEPVRAETFKKFNEYFKPCGLRPTTLCHGYGLAEATLVIGGAKKPDLPNYYQIQSKALEQNRAVAATENQSNTQTLVGCGHPADDAEVIIVNPNTLTRCPPNHVGEIWLKSPSVAHGYWQRTVDTTETFQAYLTDTGSNPFLRTGDLGFIRENDNELFVTGRLKDVIIIRGGNHYPQDIELTVEKSHQALRHSGAGAFSVKINSEEQLVVAQEIERTAIKKLNVDEVVSAILQAVSEQHELQVYAVLLLKPATLPKTSSGKVQRGVCRDGFLKDTLKTVARWQQYIPVKKSETNQNNDYRSVTVESIQTWLLTKLSEQLNITASEIDIQEPLARYGLDSLTAVSLSGELETWLKRSLSPTIMYDYPSIQLLSQYLAGESGSSQKTPLEQKTASETIAIIGMGCRFPGAENPQAFWQLLHEGKEAITEVPASRWDINTFYDPNPEVPGKMNTRWGGFLEEVAEFDPQFFSISSPEAKSMDPQQRLLLEVSWEALENAGIAPDKLKGSQTAVFIGISTNDYAHLQSNYGTTPDAYSGSGNAFSIAANRLSYLWDLRGPSITVDTACSSSLVAIHQACQNLRLGECNLALVGGVNLILTPDLNISFSQAGMLAADGHCKTFDANADGYVRSEGCGIVVLKRFAEAVKDGDNILAIIKGSAINQDGRTNGLTAPNGLSQQAVVRKALKNAGVAASHISCVETHGTGTSLGDPIEVNALKEVLMEGRSTDKPCWISSVKTNIGHLEAAAGIASLIKVVLSLQHEEIFPHLHLKKLNPLIKIAETPLSIPTRLQKYHPHFAGISSFGFGGTNAHVVLEKPSKSQAKETFSMERSRHLFTLSAKNESALRALAQRYETYLQSNSEDTLSNICFTANTGRTHFNHRLAIIADSTTQLREQLSAFSIEKPSLDSGFSGVLKYNHKAPQIAFLFTGQGSQYVGMGRELYETHPIFRQTLEHCDDILRPYLETPLLKVLYGNEKYLNSTTYTQPALFALEYALAELWQSWGIKPAVVMGHSVGEYVAACVAGVFNLKDGLKLVVERANLMQSLPQKGEMAAVFADKTQVTAAIEPYSQLVSIAALNEPDNVVISGESEAIQNIVTVFEGKSIGTRKLQVSHAFHSPLIEPMLDAFEQVASQVLFQKQRIPLISNVTGQILEQAPDARYWRTHTRSSVNFMTGMKTLFEQGYEYFLEMGPKPVLSNLGQACQPDTVKAAWLPSLKQNQADWQVLLSSLSTLYAQGADINWTVYDKDYPRSRLSSLPTYPFQRQRYWINHGESVVQKQTFEKNTQTHKDIQSRKDSILSTVRTLIAELLQITPAEIDVTMPLLEMGADSLVITQAIRRIENYFGLTFTIRQFFEDLNTPEALAAYIDQQLTPELTDLTEPTSEAESDIETKLPLINIADDKPVTLEPDKTLPDTALEHIMDQQIQAMSKLMSHQLEVLHGKSFETEKGKKKEEKKKIKSLHLDSNNQTSKLETKNSPLPPWRMTEIRARGLSSQQQRHLETLVARYTKRTPKSKQLTQHNRSVLADSRASAGFRMSTKEMLYPIFGERALGAKIWDIDGNKYTDITMGFGVNLFGHHPPFILEALEQQLQKTMQLGLQTPLAGQVAHLICELTGMERVTFCNTGTEAVMTAMRLARTATDRNKIVQFTMSYHGHFDGTLGEAQEEPENLCAMPVAPGVTPNAVADAWVLDYGKQQSLDLIRAHADELAAVLVEPVQSRRPDLQPKAFLQQLRQITLELNIPLIFDEMITGFRIHPGGAQAWFGVQADIATYGKIVGGGMPIGIIAGKAIYMDGIDGGFWNYGDASYPQANTTFFAGTFGKHPLAMATALAVLQQIKQQGPALQKRLNQRTTYLVNTLNDYFKKQEMPIRLVQFASLFRFTYSGNLDLLYYHLLEKGIYVWEGRNCFLSTAHTDEDIEHIIKAVKESVDELRQGEFLPPKGPTPPTGNKIKGKSHKVNQSASAIPLTTMNFSKGVAAEKTQKIPLTEAQKQLWVLTRIKDEGSLAYNVYLSLQLRGNFNLAAMHQAVQQVVNRHEALRTVISNEGDFQQCLPSLSIEVPFVDFSGNSAQECEGKLTSFLEQESRKLFDLTQGPLIRVHLVKLEKDRHLLVLTAHHIIVDGLSMSLIIQEMGAFYSAACQGITCQLEPTLQFRKYIQWQTQQIQMTEMAVQKAYWLDKFSDSIPVLNLPTDHPYPPIRSYKGNRQTVRLPAKLCRDLKALGQKQGCTPFMTFLSAYTMWLYRITGQNDILVGIPVAGRNPEGSNKLVGYCTHLLPIQTHLAGHETFITYLKTIRGILLETYEHQDYPFACLIKQLNLRRDSSHTPLVSVTFNLDKPSELPKLFELEVEWFSQPLNFTAFDISINLTDLGEELVLDCDYNTDLFNAATIERFVGHFQVLLEGIVSNPAQALSQLPLLTDAEQQQLLAWNQTQTDYPKDQTIVDLFQAQVEKTPDNIAVVFEDQQLSYQELNTKANQLAHYLMTFGVGTETLVGICVERSLEMVIGLLGILKAGAAYVPLDPDYPQERLQFMLEDSKVKVLLSQSNLLKRLPVSTETTVAAKVICLDSEWEQIAAGSGDNPVRQSGPENLAYVIYTSGSTGQPKGVLIPHSNVTHLLTVTQSIFHFNNRDVWTLFHSYAFDFSVWEVWGALFYGGKLVVVPYCTTRSPEDFYDLLCTQGVTILNQTPSAFRQLIAVEDQKDISNDLTLRLVIFGGEALEFQSLRPWFERHGDQIPQLVNMYGITETTVHVTHRRLTLADLKKPGSLIGFPLPGWQTYILDNHLQLTPIGIPGELYIGGVGLARGYLNRPNLTTEKFIEIEPFKKCQRLYKTGDLACYLPDGNIEYLGRIDNQVKIRGFRIELGEIEALLSNHPAIQKNAVIVHEDSRTDKRLVAYMILHKEQVIDNTILRDFLKKQLPDYMIPSAFITLETLPLTPNGKIDRLELQNLEVSYQLSEENFVAPDTNIEEILSSIWVDVLGVERVGVHDNFFELGGDSIKAIQIAAHLKRKKMSIKVADIFNSSTISELADKVFISNKIAEQSIVSGKIPLSAIQSRFFKEYGDHWNHYTLAILLRSKGSLDDKALNAVLNKIQEHHDALRMVYRYEEGQIIQENKDLPYPLSIETINLKGVKDASLKLEYYCSHVSENIDLATGPLMKSILFKMDDGEQLFIAIHHLVVDGVSWRILIEDLEDAYEQCHLGKEIRLPDKTDSYLRWAEEINRYSNSEKFLEEAAYWQTIESINIASLPIDIESQTNLQKDSEKLTCQLTKQDTDLLISKANRAFRTEINDLLLTALARAMNLWHGENKTLIALEGHGREGLFEDIDITRTVGWFTSIYPVILELPESENIAYQIKSVKASLRKIPNNGIGYGLLKYLTTSKAGKEMAFNLSPQIVFNYLGQIEKGAGNQWFEIERIYDNNTVSSDMERLYDLEIEGIIVGGRLELSIDYNTKRYLKFTIERLLESFKRELREIIGHCVTKKSPDITPHDLTYKALDIFAIEEILSNAGIDKGNLQDIYPLSLMQEGMLFHSLYGAGSTAYFLQFSFPIYGTLDIRVFEDSWNELFQRYDVLRTIFAHKGLEQPLQIVLKERKIGFIFEDISAYNEDRQSNHIKELKAKERQQGFDLSRDVLMKITIFKCQENSYYVHWAIHHIIMDGWCLGIIIKELLHIYDALKRGDKPLLESVTPYSKYIEWLGQSDKEAAKDYWTNYLAGYNRIASLPKIHVNLTTGNEYELKSITGELSESVTIELKQLAAKHHVTINVVILSIWGIILSKYNSSDDVVYGSVVSGRPVELLGIDKMVGLFLNTIPIRIVIDSKQSFEKLISEVQKHSLASEAYQYYPLADIQAVSDLKHELLDNIVVFENYPLSEEIQDIGKIVQGDFTFGVVEEFSQTNYNFTLEVYPGNKLRFKLNYNSLVHSDKQIEEIKGHITNLIKKVTHKPDMELGEIRTLLMTEKEKGEQEKFLNVTMEISEDF